MNPIRTLDIIDRHGHHHVADPDIADLAWQLVKAYEVLRPTFGGRGARGKVSAKTYKHFYKAAQKCRLQGLTAEQFVKQQLEGMAKVGTIYPSAIACGKFVQSHDEHQMLCLQLGRHYKSQLNCLNDLGSIYGYREILSDLSVQLTPLFRTAFAFKLGYPEIVRKFRDEALIELRANPIAHKAFAGYLGWANENDIHS